MLYVRCDMLCNRLLEPWVGRDSDHEFSNNNLRNRSKVWTIHSWIKIQDFRFELILVNLKMKIFLSDCFEINFTRIWSNVDKCKICDLSLDLD